MTWTDRTTRCPYGHELHYLHPSVMSWLEERIKDIGTFHPRDGKINGIIICRSNEGIILYNGYKITEYRYDYTIDENYNPWTINYDDEP